MTTHHITVERERRKVARIRIPGCLFMMPAKAASQPRRVLRTWLRGRGLGIGWSGMSNAPTDTTALPSELGSGEGLVTLAQGAGLPPSEDGGAEAAQTPQ
jgi:hypothetical protein